MENISISGTGHWFLPGDHPGLCPHPHQAELRQAHAGPAQEHRGRQTSQEKRVSRNWSLSLLVLSVQIECVVVVVNFTLVPVWMVTILSREFRCA